MNLFYYNNYYKNDELLLEFLEYNNKGDMFVIVKKIIKTTSNFYPKLVVGDTTRVSKKAFVFLNEIQEPIDILKEIL